MLFAKQCYAVFDVIMNPQKVKKNINNFVQPQTNTTPFPLPSSPLSSFPPSFFLNSPLPLYLPSPLFAVHPSEV